MSGTIPRIPWKARDLLDAFNRRWSPFEARLRLGTSPVPIPSRQCSLPPSQAPEAFLWGMMEPFLADLERIARHVLPHPSWVPGPLRSRSGHTQKRFPDAPATLLQFWRFLPPEMAGRLTFFPHEWLPLFCALADPPRYGTNPGRYPEQLQALKDRDGGKKPAGFRRALDIGCGIGLGTLELAQVLAEKTGEKPEVTGVTIEPLEAWMGTRRCVPHDLARQARMLSFPRDLRVSFVAGDALALPCRGPFQLIVCNGLVGGPMLADSHAYTILLNELERLLSPDGCAAMSTHFHEGIQRRTEHFMAVARERGWNVQGTITNLTLTRIASSSR